MWMRGAGGGTRDDGIRQAGETPIPGTTVTLFRVLGGLTTSISQTTTDATGFYRFTNLPAGTGYLVRETQPAGFNDGKDTPGTTGGSNAVNDELSSITVPAGGESLNNNFGELIQTGALSGFVYVDEGVGGGTRDDGIKQPGETPIPGATVTLFRVVGGATTSIGQTTTDAAGFYRFTNLTPGGGYLVRETQPAGFADGKDTVGSTGGSNAVNDELSGVTVPVNGESVNNNFGELLQLGALSGFVYVDEGAGGGTRDDGIKQAGEPGIANVPVTLFRVVDGQTTSIGQTSTDGSGFYRFANLVPGGGYVVRETQPTVFLDGKDTAGSTGGTVTNDQIAAITVPAGGESTNNNFGELLPPPLPARLSGFVYEDDDNDGVKDPTEAPIPGTVVTLTGGTLTLTATTNAAGFYEFTNLPAGTYTVTETQPAGYLDGKDTAGTKGGTVTNDRIATIPLLAGDNSEQNNFGELRPARLSGFEYVDEGAGGGTRDDGIKQAGEPGIPGTRMVLTGTNDLGAVTLTTTTDAIGFYTFGELRPGTYTVTAAQPADFADGKDTPGSTGGTAPQNDTLTGIPIQAGDNSQNNNFGELLRLGALSGFVYVDEGAGGGTRDDGIRQPGETPIPGTTVTLLRVVDGQTTTLGQTTTDAAGFYRFANLVPGGGYIVRETQPAAFVDGKDTAGSTGGVVTNDQIAAITVPAGGESVNNNFGELLPAGSLSGFVYEDDNDDGVKDPTEAPIAGVTVTLFRVVDGVTTSIGQTTTDATGFYQFTGLTPGTGYRIVQTQPAGYQDGKDTPGSTGGTNATNDVLEAVTVPTGGASVNNNFGERLGRLSGFVYVDEGAGGGVRDDGIKQAGEPGIPGTTVTLFRISGGTSTSVGQTTTDATGFYQFTRLAPGTYEVRETQPAGFSDGKDTPDAGNGGTSPTNDVISTITLGGTNDLDSPNNNFGELLPRGALSGFVYVDADDDGVKDPGEASIPGTTVTLFRVVGGTTTSIGQTTTDAAGAYRFTDLIPGDGYLVRETQPAGFNDGKDTAGSTGGVVTNDQIAAITVPAGGESVNNNFGELLVVPPAQLSGFVYVDADNDGIKDPGETPIPGTTVTLFRVVNGTTTSVGQATTDASGFYSFTNLPAGTYEVRETQPAGFDDGKDTPGSTGGVAPQNDRILSIPLVAGANSQNNNFGERTPVPPVPPPGGLSGFVYEDDNDNGVKDAGEKPIPGTVITLIRQDTGATVSQTTTDANGFYRFTNLTPSQYTVRETQPPRYIDGKDTPGTTGGSNAVNDVLSSVTVPSGVESQNNNFGELPCVTLYGYVWYDVNRNGRFDPSEVGLGGATVTISGTTNGGRPLTTSLTNGTPLSVTTDVNGRYAFTCLPTGTYTLVQTNTPAGFTDFQSENAARITVGSSTATSFAGAVLTRDSGPLNFGKVTDSIIVPPPPPNPQNPDPSKRNFLGSASQTATAISPPATQNPQLPAPEVGPFNPAQLGSGGANVAPRLYAVGAGAGAAPVVRVFDAATGGERFRIQAYESAFTGGVSTAIGDVNGDGIDDIITAALAGGGPRVRAFDGVTGNPIADFFAYSPTFSGGVWVASADIDGDGADDIITGAGDGGGPHLKAFSGRTGAVLVDQMAFDPNLRTGVRVAAGDFNGDGKADIAATTGPGAAATVVTFDPRTQQVFGRFAAYEPAFTGGAFIAAGDVNGDGRAEVITGAGLGGGARARVLDATSGAALYDFFADASTSGVRVAARDLNGDGLADIVTGSGIGLQARIQVFSGAGLGKLDDFFAFESGIRSGVFVG